MIERAVILAAGRGTRLGGSRMVHVVEKPLPGTTESHWNLAGVSVYGAAIWPALAALKPSARGEYELTDGVGALIASGEEVRAVKIEGFWSDVGTPEALRSAEEHLAVEIGEPPLA